MKFVFVLVAIFALIFASVQAADKSVCSQPKEVGPCRKSDFVFYYDNDAKECKEFIYGGCKGNDNRFQSKEECQKTCQ